ncbi:MAG: polysaccharide deacetylase family protein [Anaerolineales bacterium]|nr:polysaccharide deacetylase family protein [Anaerolineales bacterium]
MNPLLTRAFYYTGAPSLAGKCWAQRKRFVIMFHGISARKYDSIHQDAQPRLSCAELDSILQWIKPRFDFLTPREFFDTEKIGVLLTFDDGFANNETNALPVLERHQAPAIFFVTTQHVTAPRNWLPATRRSAQNHWRDLSNIEDALAADFFDGMSENQLRRCAEHPLITIGSHTLSHPFLTQSDPSALTFELTESKRLLESLAQSPIDFFAYPTGDYNAAVMDGVKNAGYRAAFAVDSLRLGSPIFEIPRVGLYSADTAYLALKLSGLHRPPLSPSLCKEK